MTAVDRLQQQIAELPSALCAWSVYVPDERREVAAVEDWRVDVTCQWGTTGKSWQSPLVRELGSMRPTVWLLDARGRLRSLNALEGRRPRRARSCGNAGA